jgi:undecaprenyl-diphosphatase
VSTSRPSTHVDWATAAVTAGAVVRALTHLGDPLVVSLATLLLAAGLAAVGAFRAAAYLAVVRVVAVVTTAGIKEAVGRARPDHLQAVVVAHGYSFPSGHAAGSAALWCSVAMLIATRAPRPLVVAVALVVPTVVAATRVLLGVHFLTDALAGVLLGVEIAVVLARLRSWRLLSSFPRG